VLKAILGAVASAAAANVRGIAAEDSALTTQAKRICVASHHRRLPFPATGNAARIGIGGRNMIAPI